MKKLTRNYYILAPDWDLYKFAFSDLEDLNNATFVAGWNSKMNGFQRLLCKIHLTPKINRYIKLPFKNIWHNIVFDDLVKEEGSVFVLFSTWVIWNEELGFIRYIREKCRGAKIVWFLCDLFGSLRTGYGKPIDLEKVRKQFDLILSFDQGDCEKYGFVYHPLVFSIYRGEMKDMPYSDVYFLGQAKNRLDDIIGAYEFLSDKGLKCDFHITRVPKEMQKYSDKIDYKPNFSYDRNIQHILHTRCLLEVMQKGGVGLTQRGVEIVGMDKMLLTNNARIDEAPFYNPEYICQYKRIEEIPDSFIERIKMNPMIDYHYKNKLSPVELLSFIEERL